MTPRCLNRFLAALVLLSPLSLRASQDRPVAQQPAAVKQTVDFNSHIRPILSENCFRCHGPDETQRKAKLRLDLRDGATAKLRSGRAAIVAGKVDESELIARISADDPHQRMPPPRSNRKLTPAQIDLLKRWIEQGAEYSRHWAFVAPKRPDIPAVKNNTWPRNPIDNFILQRLEQEGLTPSPEASRETLLRRASLDLTGLPPSREELARNDQSPDAYEKSVDRLLALPSYGERMAYAWLDQARYADTNGYNNDEERTMWPWRDWVINAYNRNLPFDRFLVEQLAGDLLPGATLEQKIATGFNRNHVLTTEGGIVEDEYRVEYVADRVHTTATVFLGLSMQCARCHDHKYDPISQKEYYQFFAFFNNLPDKVVNYGKATAADPIVKYVFARDRAKLAEMEKRQAALQAQFDKREARAREAGEVEAWEKNLTPSQKARLLSTGLTLHFPLDEMKGNEVKDAVDGSRQGTIHGKPAWIKGKIAGALNFDGQTYVDLGPLGNLDGKEAFSIAAWVFATSPESIAIVSKMNDADAHRGYDVLLEGGKVAVHLVHRWPDDALKVMTKTSIGLNAWHHVLVTHDGSRKGSGLDIYVDGVLRETNVVKDALKGSIDTKQSLHIGKRGNSLPFKGKIDDVRFYSAALSGEEAGRLAHGETEPRLVLAVPAAKRSAEQQAALRRFYLENTDKDYRQARADLADIVRFRSDLEKFAVGCMVMADMSTPRDTFILKRGQYDQRGDKVSTGVPTALPALPADAPRNRLGLARWLVEPSHPLTARVAVNRLWALHFGTGLVETLEDFGLQGELPSHPELLDWLATEFIRTGWDVKAMQRLIVTSATYRQSARATPLLLERDPKNRLLARSPRFRLPAETLRDNALAISGLLKQQIGGPSVKPYQPAGLWEEVSVERRYKYVADKGDKLYRRSLYTFWRRTIPPPAMTTFDAPDRETCVIRRARTNTPLQALILMNDPTYVEAARKLAEAMFQAGPTFEDRLALGFQRALSRRPTVEEGRIVLALYQDALENYRKDPKAAEKLLAVGDAPRDAKLDPVELAAWSVAASTILNLDETISRP